MTTLRGGDLPGTGPRIGKLSPAALTNTYITNCKLCPYGVYKTQEYVWLNNPVGYSHTACVQQREASTQESPDA
jgi:hypothetical protein